MSNKHPSAGFSLLEIMVVLVIIGGLFSFAVISMKPGDIHASVAIEVRRLAAYLQAAQEEAILKNQELALRFEHNRYKFMRLEQGKWELMEDDPVFKQYILPSQMRLYVDVLDGSIPLADDKRATEAMVLILSSGEISPFELSVASPDGYRYSMRSNFMGRVEMFDPLSNRK